MEFFAYIIQDDKGKYLNYNWEMYDFGWGILNESELYLSREIADKIVKDYFPCAHVHKVKISIVDEDKN